MTFTPIESSVTPPTSRRSLGRWLASGLGVVLFGLLSLLWYLIQLNMPPNPFVSQVVEIEPGTSVRAITEQLKDAEVVRSSDFLYFLLVWHYDTTDIKASTYHFTEPLSTASVAAKLAEGDFSQDLLRLTHIEGERIDQLAERAAAVLPEFDTEAFIAAAEPLEGRLFPDTYHLPSSYTETELLTLLSNTFTEKTAFLQPLIVTHDLSEVEIITLASILEREANSPESKAMVSGILQNRLAIGMPLQADATIEYALKIPLKELPEGQLATELRTLDTPYNTYLYTGLPPTPIGNPGLIAIEAVLKPTSSEYLYYLTDPDGTFYYASTLAEHNANIARYLR